MRELVRYLARSLVDDPDAVEVTETQGEVGSVLELRVDTFKQTFGDADYLAANPAYRAGAERPLFCLVAGQVRRMESTQGTPATPAVSRPVATAIGTVGLTVSPSLIVASGEGRRHRLVWQPEHHRTSARAPG